MAARAHRAVVGDRSAQGGHRLAAVRRRAAARLHASVHQGARPVERARDARTRSRSRTRRSPETCAATSPARWPSSTSARSAALSQALSMTRLLGKSSSRTCPCAVGERIGLLEPVPPGCRPARARRATRSAGTSTRRTCAPSSTRSRDLAKSAIETAADKQAYPGATALLRALRQDGHRICIVSGSPTQMRQVLAAKLALDGIEYDEFVLKNNLKNILRGRFRALRAQIPYKLPAMLQSRIGAAAAPRRCSATTPRPTPSSTACTPTWSPGASPRRISSACCRFARLRRRRRAHPRSRARASPRATRSNRMFIHLDRRVAAARVPPVRPAPRAGVQLLPGRARAVQDKVLPRAR